MKALKAATVEDIRFKNEQIKQQTIKYLESADMEAVKLLFQSLYQNGHKVILSKIGESRSGGIRRNVILIAAENMNGRKISYKVDLREDGDDVKLLSEKILSGWQPVIIW